MTRNYVMTESSPEQEKQGINDRSTFYTMIVDTEIDKDSDGEPLYRA